MCKHIGHVQPCLTTPGLPPFLENEISGVSRRTFFNFLGETKGLLMICSPQNLGNKENFKPFQTVFPAENKGLVTYFLAIFISCLESKPLKKCFWLLFPSVPVSMLYRYRNYL